MIETYSSVTSIALMALIQCVDIQIPYLNNPIAFVRFEGQSLAVTLLKSLNLGINNLCAGKELKKVRIIIGCIILPTRLIMCYYILN